MNSSNKNIDQLFREAAQQEKASLYQDAYWDEMAQILNQKKSRKGFFIWIFSGIIALSALGALFLFGAKEVIQPRYTLTELENAVIVENTTITEDSKDEENTVLKTENKIKTKALANNKTQKIGKPRGNTQDALFAQNKQQETSYSDELLTSNQQATSSVAEDKTELVKTEKFALIEKQNTENSNKLENAFDENYEEQIQRLAIIERNTIEEKSYKPDKELRMLVSPSASYFRFSLQANGGIMENYKSGRPFESGLVSLSAQVEYRHKRLIFRTGLGTQLTTNADLIVSKKSRVFGFGLNDLQNDLSYQELIDIYLPVEFGYRYKSTSFGVGVQANLLTATTMNLDYYKNGDLVATERFNGNKDGLNLFSTQGYIWLEQEVLPRFALGLKIGTNISGRIQKGEYFYESDITNPVYGQLSLRYLLRR